MATSDRYVLFPISALWLEANPNEVAEQQATNRVREIRLFSVAAFAQSLDDHRTVDAMVDRWDGGEVNAAPEIIAGAVHHGLTAGDLNHWRNVDNAAEAILERLQQPFGRKMVSMRMDILRSVESGAMTWRQFAVLAAVYACLTPTQKSAARGQALYRDQLQAMASGFGSSRIAKEHGVTDKSVFLTEKQIRGTLDHLEARRFFVRVPLDRRTTYFSNRLNLHQLERYVAEIQASKQLKRSERAEAKAESSVRVQKLASERATNRATRRATTRATNRAATEEPVSEETCSKEPSSEETPKRRGTQRCAVADGSLVVTHSEADTEIHRTSTTGKPHDEPNTTGDRGTMPRDSKRMDGGGTLVPNAGRLETNVHNGRRP